MSRTIGRPRAQASATGRSTQQDIVAAAARVFTEVGYGSASTHKIAREARISQPTLYHYYAGKADLLLELLLETVGPSVAFAEAQQEDDGPATSRLAALCLYDVTLLLAGEHNIGGLYLLPELAEQHFAPFHSMRTRLYRCYRGLAAEILGVETDAAHPRASLVFGLVESTILRRRTQEDLDATVVGADVADAALAILGASRSQRARAVERGRRLAATALEAAKN